MTSFFRSEGDFSHCAGMAGYLFLKIDRAAERLRTARDEINRLQDRAAINGSVAEGIETARADAHQELVDAEADARKVRKLAMKLAGKIADLRPDMAYWFRFLRADSPEWSTNDNPAIKNELAAIWFAAVTRTVGPELEILDDTPLGHRPFIEAARAQNSGHHFRALMLAFLAGSDLQRVLAKPMAEEIVRIRKQDSEATKLARDKKRRKTMDREIMRKQVLSHELANNKRKSDAYRVAAKKLATMGDHVKDTALKKWWSDYQSRCNTKQSDK